MPLPVSKLADISRNKVAQNTLAIGAALSMMGVGFHALEERASRAVPQERARPSSTRTSSLARAGYEYATQNFKPFAEPLPMTENRYAVLSGNAAMAMGGAAAGVKFYCAYPMSPSTGVLHWMAAHGRKAGIMVRQVEDEIGVINMAIGAAHAGVRAMCATSGGGFALMSEGLGLSAKAEIPDRGDRLPACGPVDRRADQDRAGRSVADAGRGLWRLSPRDCRAAGHRRLLHADAGDLQHRRPLPVSGNRAVRSAAVRGPAERRPEVLDFNPQIDRGETDHFANGEWHTERTCATRSPRAAFPRARFPACPATPTWSRATSTMRTAC